MILACADHALTHMGYLLPTMHQGSAFRGQAIGADLAYIALGGVY